MKQKEQHLEVEGKIVQQFTAEKFLIEIEGGHMVKAHRSGKLRYIRLTVGDKVLVGLSPYQLDAGIIRRTIR